LQSRDYTVADFWFKAKRDLGDIRKDVEFERFDLVNRTVSVIGGQFYDLFAPSYMTDAYLNNSTGGKYDAGTGGTYTSATHLIALNSPSEDLTNADLEKLVVFRIGTTNYVGKVLSVASTSSFVFDGDIYPSTDGTIVDDSLAICDTTPLNDTISLSALRIMKTSVVKISLSTTASATIRGVTQRELDTFLTGNRNANTIVWCLNGDNIDLRKGSGLASYGTLEIHYPRVPYLVGADTDNLDLPDGTAIELGIIYLRGLIQRRVGLPIENNLSLIQQLVENLYRSNGQVKSIESIKEISKALALS
jgi:hypothetical protein